MKVTKRFLAILMSVCMMVGMLTMTAFAEGTGSITIQNPSHSDATVAGKTFNVYKIFNATTDGTSTSYSWYEQSEGYIPFYDFFYGADGVVEKNKTDGNVQAAVEYVNGRNTSALEMSQFAEELHQYVVSKSISAFTTKVCDSTDVSAKIEGLPYGYYLVYDATDLTGENQSAVRSAVMLTTVNKDVVITLKANRPEIDKTVLENDGITWGKGTSSMIGDDVTFRIDTLVPSHTMYDSYQYYIEDTMHNGLVLDENSIKVYKNEIKEENILTAGADYELTIPTSGNVDFKVDFTNSINNFAVNEKLIIVYKANVTSTIEAQKANVNTAKLVYSNDPTNDESLGSTSSTANVYSYQFVFSKYAQDTNGVFKNVRLIGAEFQLYRVVDSEGNKELVKFKTVTATNSEGATFTKYIVADADDAPTVDKLTVHKEGDETITLSGLNYGGHRGDVFIFGLSEGKYELVETKAPDGYLLPDAPFSIEVVDEIGVLGSVGTLSVTGSHNSSGSIVNMNGIGESILTVWADITNEPGSALPETGGIGTTVYMVAGLAIMICAATILVYKKRNSAR